MSWIRVDLAEGRTAYRPGEEVAGTVSWSLGPEEAPAESVWVHLLWFTRGKADRDSAVVASRQLTATPSRSEQRDFRLRLPAGPYSVAGKLVSIVWGVEAVLDPGGRAEQVEIVVSPTGREVVLHPGRPGAAPGPEERAGAAAGEET